MGGEEERMAILFYSSAMPGMLEKEERKRKGQHINDGRRNDGKRPRITVELSRLRGRDATRPLAGSLTRRWQ